MAYLRNALIVLALLVAASQAQIDSPINGRPVTVVDAGLPNEGSSTQGSDPSISDPDEVFSATHDGYGISVGTDDGKPVLSGRKMLQQGGDLQLSGSGVSAGDSNLGVTDNAYGHGQLVENGNSVQDTHIEPHGDNYGVSVGGQETSSTVAADPDGFAGEGPVVTATGRK